MEGGVALEQSPERLEPADGVLRRIRAVDANDEDLGTVLLELVPAPTDRLAGRERVELGGVDGDRVRVRHLLRILPATEEGLAGCNEGRAPLLGVEPHAVAREEALVDRPRYLGRQDGPGVGPDPRDVDEEGDPSIRAHLADERGDEVEVVVVDVERRAGSPIELCDRRLGDRAVGGRIAVAPRHGQVGVRVALEAPQTVLHEPEDRVRDDAVEQAIRLRIVRDEPEPERRPGGGALVAGSGGAELLLDISHRAGDPGDVAAIDEGAERGDEAACAAHGAQRAVRVAAKADRAAVRDDDERPGQRGECPFR